MDNNQNNNDSLNTVQNNNVEIQSQTVNQTSENGKKETIEMVEFSNDITESKGILNDDTTTKPQNDFSDKTIDVLNKIVNTADYTSYFGTEEVTKYKTYAIMCYIPFVALYFKYIKKIGTTSKYVDYHAKEGINLTLLWIITVVVSKILYATFTKVYLASSETPVWVSFISYVLYTVSIVLTVLGMYRTNKGKSIDLPLIGKYKFLK